MNLVGESKPLGYLHREWTPQIAPNGFRTKTFATNSSSCADQTTCW